MSKRRTYMREYHRNRYRNDPEFRDRKLNVSRPISKAYRRNAKTITHSDLIALLEYDPDTGVFRWKVGRYIGRTAGWTNQKTGRLLIGVKGKLYYANRLAWFYMTGEWPESDVDHIDEDKTNNAFANLQLLTRTDNLKKRWNAQKGNSVPTRG